MNLWAEIKRVLLTSRVIKRGIPSHKIFTGIVPNTVQNPDTGKDEAVDAPYMNIMGPDSDTSGRTSAAINRSYIVQVSAYHAKRSEAVKLRDAAAAALEEADLVLVGEKLFDISQTQGGVADPVKGVYQAYQRFSIETVVTKPNRKG